MGITVAHLYPEELGLYGDRGNLLTLLRRLKLRGYHAEVKEIRTGEHLGSFDILFIGGGQDREMKIIARDLLRKSEEIAYAVHTGKVILAICGGYQLLGEYYRTADGNEMHLTGALPFYTVAGKKRQIGNTVYDSPFGKIVGFENHSGLTFLDKSLTPLGTVVKGCGNNGTDGTEGVLYQNTFGTYAHGPVLPKNPALADELLCRALHTDSLPPLEDELEQLCHNQLLQLK